MVYNSESDSCREVTVTPNAAWGGEGRYCLEPEGHRARWVGLRVTLVLQKSLEETAGP
jgi:hypothetical protein